MSRYFVTWEIDVEDEEANDPRAAAANALDTLDAAIQALKKDGDTFALNFTVDDRETGETHHVNLGREE